MAHWDKVYKKGKKYDYYDLNSPHPDMKKAAGIFKKNKIKKILDLGCGSGRNLIYLHNKGFEVEGIDIARKGIKRIKENLGSSVKLKVADIYKRLPYKDESFDAVISVQVLQHNKEPAIKRAIDEIYRILKPGGLIFVTVCGRISKGKVRLFLVKSAKKIAANTYVPTQGHEAGLTHFIYSKKRILEHFRMFKKIKLWKDDKDYYCLLARKL